MSNSTVQESADLWGNELLADAVPLMFLQDLQNGNASSGSGNIINAAA